jgi:hypothetical protein
MFKISRINAPLQQVNGKAVGGPGCTALGHAQSWTALNCSTREDITEQCNSPVTTVVTSFGRVDAASWIGLRCLLLPLTSSRSLRLNSCADWSSGEDGVGVAVHDSPGISLASEDHGDPQRDGTHVRTTRQPRLGSFDLDDVAKVGSAVSRHFLETTY